MNSIMDNSLQKLVDSIASQTEDIMLEQLSDLVARGLLVVEKGPMTLVQENSLSKHEIKVKQTISLKLRDREYIVKLEQENKELKDQLKTILNLKEGLK